MNDTVLAVLFIAGVFTLFFATALPLTYVVNRAIGRSFDAKRIELFARIEAEGILYAEDDVQMRLASLAFLAAGMSWRRADVRITQRGLYVAQYGKYLGTKMGQPILVVPLTPMGLDPAAIRVGHLMQIRGQAKLDGRTLELPLETARSKNVLRLELRDPEAALQLIDSITAGVRT